MEEEGKDLTVEALLNTPSNAVGTLLHLATKVSFLFRSNLFYFCVCAFSLD